MVSSLAFMLADYLPTALYCVYSPCEQLTFGDKVTLTDQIYDLPEMRKQPWCSSTGVVK